MENLKNLNPPQLEAVTTFGTPILILAGAGSGKTRTLTYKIGYMIKELGTKPHNILAMTFTNKAALEMKERVSKILDTQCKGLWIGTFHSICLRILRKNCAYLGSFDNFVIYDDNDQIQVIKKVLKDMNISDKLVPPRSLQYFINNQKNNGNTPERCSKLSRNPHQEKYINLYNIYQKKLTSSRAMDFGDILLQTTLLFEKNQNILDYYRDKFKYIMVDEYQDTNHVQYVLLNLLSKGKKEICVVGDDDQSIYRWRGADISNILNFKKDFPDSKIIKLEQNYRSTKTILETSQHIISENGNRMDKRLWTENPEGSRVSIFFARDDLDEARFISNKINSLRKKGEKLSNMAVFYRTNAQSRAFEEEFMRNNIQNVVVGSFRFFERKEIKDIISFLNFIVNPYDILTLKRIVDAVPCGLGEKTLEKIEERAKTENVDILTALGILSTNDSGQKKESISNLYEKLLSYKNQLDKLPPAELIEQIAKTSGIIEAYRQEEEREKSISRVDNIIEFVNSSYQYFTNNPKHKMRDFLDRISLVSDTDKIGSKSNSVTIMTLHCAKGLEFDYVFIAGFEDNLLPHKRSVESLEEMEEERRLCYVGFTRAKKMLFLSCASYRMFFGRFEMSKPSRFMSSIPETLLEKHFSESLYQ